VTLAAPIETGDARFMGVLAARLTFEALDSLLGGVAPGEGGRVDLVTADGLLVASSGDRNGSPGAERVSSESLGALVASDGGSIEYTDRRGTPVVGTLTGVPGLTWAVIAQIPSAEAYAQVAQLRNSALLLVAVLLVVVGGAAYLLGSVIVRPLARLTEGAGAVAAGDLSVDLPGAGRGEVGYLTQVFNDMVGRLRRSREELAERNRELERLSVTDLLTGLHNRRYLIEAFEKEIQRADRHERPFCVIMLDVDRFKQYNDTHGHLAGDQVLVAMGRVMREATRELDVLARYGGEEFIALLPECDLENGVKAAERIRERLSREVLEHGPVTVSVGVAEFPAHGDTPSAVIGAADEALYEAKRQGRDRVLGAAPPGAPAEGKKKATKRTAAAKKKRA
jgi:diguanylate cyclase (GGDEF)-like protein